MFLGQALPVSLHHQLRGTRLPLGERAQVLRQALRLLQCHMAVGRLLHGTPSDRCRALIPLGGRLCAGLRARLFFAARADMVLQLQGLALHLQDAWLHRLRTLARIRPRTLARIRPGGATRFLVAYFPCPLDGGLALLPYARQPRRVHAPGVARAKERRPRRQGEGRSMWEPGAHSTTRHCAIATCSWLGTQPMLPRRARGAQGAGTSAPPPPPPANVGARAGRCWRQRLGRRGRVRSQPGWGGLGRHPRRCQRQTTHITTCTAPTDTEHSTWRTGGRARKRHSLDRLIPLFRRSLQAGGNCPGGGAPNSEMGPSP